MGCFANIIFGILQFSALALLAVGIPFDQFRPKGDKQTSLSVSSLWDSGYCITLWGIKHKCYDTKYDMKANELFAACGSRPRVFRAAEVCALIAIVAVLVSLIFSFLLSCCCCCLKPVCVFLNMVAMVALCVTWACMLVAFYRDSSGGSDSTSLSGNPCVRLRSYTGPDGTFDQGMRLGTGFLLMIVAWAVIFVNAFIILIPC